MNSRLLGRIDTALKHALIAAALALVATAVAVRRTVPLIMTWTTLFFFFRRLAEALVDRLYYDPRWRLPVTVTQPNGAAIPSAT